MDACQPARLMTITNFVIVIRWCAQSNLLICRDERCPVWDERLPVRLVAGRPVLPSGHRERLLLPVPAAMLADAGAEASLFRDLLGGGVPEQAGSLRRIADHRTG
jgi:hypothetical protein